MSLHVKRYVSLICTDLFYGHMCIHNYDNICEVLTISCRGELTAHRIYVMIFSKWIRCYAHRVMCYISVCMHLHFRQKDTTRVKGLYTCNGFEMVITKCYYVLIMNTTSPLINYDMVICTLKTETQFQSGCGKNDCTLQTLYAIIFPRCVKMTAHFTLCIMIFPHPCIW